MPDEGLTPYESYVGGSAEAERAAFAGYARDLMRVQEANRRASGAAAPARAFHAQPVLGVANAHLDVLDDLPRDLRRGCFRPGARLPVTLRFSNASGIPAAGTAPDLRGVALRIEGDDGVHDLLATSFPVSPAADAREFVAVARAMAGRRSRISRMLGLVLTLPPAVGPAATVRIVRNLTRSARVSHSLAEETYWSRGAILWGAAGPVRYRLAPLPAGPGPARAAGGLREDLTRRLAGGDVVFELAVQRYVSPERTPVEDTAKAWDTPWEPVARLVVPAQDVDTAEAREAERCIEALAFNPWNTTAEFRPLGNLNRARRAAYEASSAHRLGHRALVEEPVRTRIAGALAERMFGLVNRRLAWYRLPVRAALLNLAALRRQLRRDNLVDVRPAGVGVRAPDPPVPPEALVRRTADGRWNDLSEPEMGAAGTPFGRNLPPDRPRPDLPDPIQVSRLLLTRDEFIPARTLNLLAAAWIQFQVHDWVHHPRVPVGTRSIDLPLTDGREWRNVVGGPLEPVMRIADDDHAGDVNTVTHWWDGSEVYGADPATAAALREDHGAGSRLRLVGGFLPDGPDGRPRSGFTESWWLGLSLLQTLFAREHNAVCDALHAEYPTMPADRAHQVARLVVSALIAKIHTVEWTPAILGTETLERAMSINWRGTADRLTRLGLRLFDPYAVDGIPGSQTDHHGVPYALTEEFVTVYRMHPLIPDDYVFVNPAGEFLEQRTFAEIQGPNTEPALRKLGLSTTAYSFGIANPGAVTLHNFPRALQHFERDGEIVDLSVVDIVRTRRRHVPRYNDFRAGLHLPRLRDFTDLTRDERTLAALRSLYPDVDAIDTVVGLLAETPPPGFGFGDTAFRVFLLMASRRLQSDRFLTRDYRPEVYTPLGLRWVAETGMREVLTRHCPDLVPFAGAGKAAFAPWRCPGQAVRRPAST